MKLRKIVIAGTAILIVVGSIMAMGVLNDMKEPPKKATPKVPKKYVKTQQVNYQNIPTEVIAYGRVKTLDNLDLIAEKQGRMKQGSVKLKEGYKFRKGDLLFKIDDTEARLDLQAQKSGFLSELAGTLPDFKIDFPDSYSTWSAYFKSIDLDKSLPELPQYNSAKEKTYLATKNIFSNYYKIKSAEEALRKFFVYAPFSGIITEVQLQSGSYVSPGSRVAKIHRTDKLEMKVAIETKDVPWITEGLEVEIQTESSEVTWSGYISRIGELVNENTQSVDVFVAINNGSSPIYQGQYLQVIIPGKDITEGMEVPRNVVFDKNQVYVVQDSVLKIHEVEVKRYNAETVVFAGLPAGQDLVVEPLINAHQGMKVYKLSDMRSDEDVDIDLETKENTELAGR